MLEKLLNRLLCEEEETTAEETRQTETQESSQPKTNKKELFLILAILLAGLAYRLAFIFLISGTQNAGVGWYGDTYHHWQIGYLTFAIGLKQGFLRLWDLKGMEFFWGPLHPLLLSLLFTLTGSIDILITRIVSLVFGLGSALLLFLLARRYWGKKVAFAILLFAAFFPIAVFNDVSGMLEPLGIFFLLLGIYFWPRLPFFTGFFWALATSVRAEVWTFSLGLLSGLFFLKTAVDRKVIALVGWVIPMLLYLKYLLDHTGNPIYPLWWNYLANALGVWAGNDSLTSLQLAVRPLLLGAAVVSLLALGLALYRRSSSTLFLLLGWGNIFFLGAFIGIGHYLAGWEWWFPVIRFFVFPYLFLAVILFIFLSRLRIGDHPVWDLLFWIPTFTLIIIAQLTWFPIWSRFQQTIPAWRQTREWGEQVGRFYQQGTLLFPEGDPHFTYAVVRFGHVPGDRFLSQMYDPFYYHQEEQVYQHWDRYRSLILSWLAKEDIRLAVIRHDSSRYQQLITQEPQLFQYLTTLEGGVYQIWQVFPEKIDNSTLPPRDS